MRGWRAVASTGLLAMSLILELACTPEAAPDPSAILLADIDADADGDSDSDTDSENENALNPDADRMFKTLSGIGNLPDCVLAVNGRCVKVMEHSPTDVCKKWKQDMAITVLDDFWLPGDEPCDPGTLLAQSVEDAFKRINFYRWIADLQPLKKNPDPESWTRTAHCAIVSAYNESPDPHHPLETATCFSEQGFEGAASSSIDYTPYVPAVTIDRLIFDTGESNAGTLGHRRALMAYYYDVLAIGYSRVRAGTDEMDGGTCIQASYETFRPSKDLNRRVSAYPPPGAMPHELTLKALKGSTTAPLQWHLNIMGVTFEDAIIQVFRITEDGPGQLNVETGVLTEMTRDGSGIWIQPSEELPPGEYVVDIDGTSEGEIGYRVILTDCGTGVPESCDFIAQDCGADWLGCYRSSEAGSFCMHRGYIDKGEPCRSARFCEPGLVCIDNPSTSQSVCSPYCDNTTSDLHDSCDTICEDSVVLVDEATVCQMK